MAMGPLSMSRLNSAIIAPLNRKRRSLLRIAGVIAEYNPFHNGHRYHVEAVRAAGCDAVVAVMSGNFVQRGEPAAFDQWARTRMALAAGVDAVFLLPQFWALQPAEWFACGGVRVLHGLGVDALAFGTEVESLDELRRLAALWGEEPPELKAALKKALGEGKSHPRARYEAAAALGGTGEALLNPNAVLGAMYLRWLEKLGGSITPLPVRRVAADYNDEDIRGAIASATAVRRSLTAGDGLWQQAVPDVVRTMMEQEIADGCGPVAVEDLSQMLLAALRGGAPIEDSAEGLANRMRHAAFETGGAEAFFAAVKSRRYTMARIKRAAMASLLGITAGDVALLRAEQPVYGRLLGYRKQSEEVVRTLAKRTAIPFVARPGSFRPEDGAMERLWQIDMASGDLYPLAYKNPAMRQGRRDYTEKLIVL